MKNLEGIMRKGLRNTLIILLILYVLASFVYAAENWETKTYNYKNGEYSDIQTVVSDNGNVKVTKSAEWIDKNKSQSKHRARYNSPK